MIIIGIEEFELLTEHQKMVINILKRKEEQILSSIECLSMDAESTINLDRRWVSIGKTHIEQGFMALIRAVVNE